MGEEMPPKKSHRNDDDQGAQNAQTWFQFVISLIDRLPPRWRWPSLAVVVVVPLMYLAWQALPPAAKQRILDRVVLQLASEGSAGYYPSVFVEHESGILDFSEWSQLRSSDDDRCCKATWSYKIRVRRVHDEARYFAKRLATSGLVNEVRSLTHTLASSSLETTPRPGGPAMKRYNFLFDISNQPLNEPFDLELMAAYYNGFTDFNREWAALAILQATARVTLEVRFPENKVPRNLQYEFSTRAPGDNYKALDTGEYRVCWSVSHVLTFEVDQPRLGHAYRIQWDW